jgi:hypothetical protein
MSPVETGTIASPEWILRFKEGKELDVVLVSSLSAWGIMKTYHDIKQMMEHLSAQDNEMLKQTHILIHLLQSTGTMPEQLLAEINTGTRANKAPGTTNTTNGTQP